jgi:hypothetical protein
MPVTIAIADKVRHFVSGSRRMTTEIAAANRTLVSRSEWLREEAGQFESVPDKH